MVEVARIERLMQNPRFVKRILTASERDRPLTPSYVAGRWAAKEAIAKAVGVKLRWQDIEVINDSSGVPRVYFCAVDAHDDSVIMAPSAMFRAEEISTQVQISISHERGIAAAVAVWEDYR